MPQSITDWMIAQPLKRKLASLQCDIPCHWPSLQRATARFGNIIRCCANIILNEYYAKVRWHLKIPTVIYIFRFWINKNWIFFWPGEARSIFNILRHRCKLYLSHDKNIPFSVIIFFCYHLFKSKCSKRAKTKSACIIINFVQQFQVSPLPIRCR